MKRYINRDKFEKAVANRARELGHIKKLNDLNIILNDLKMLKKIKLKEKPKPEPEEEINRIFHSLNPTDKLRISCFLELNKDTQEVKLEKRKQI